MKTRIPLLSAMSLSMLVLLAGCGGGGGGSSSNTAPVSVNPWVLLHGSEVENTSTNLGVYGVEGQPAATNTPGPRSGSDTWVDAKGRLWVLGGYGPVYGYYDDLWMFDPSVNEWTWEGGPQTENDAGVYGTQGQSSATSWPGARAASATWIDASGNLCLFGGDGYGASATASGLLNDLWCYSPSTGAWTWVGGTQATWNAGTFGTQGTASSSNLPSARMGAAAAVDGAGNVWLFGGLGVGTSSPTAGVLNDLWEYNEAAGTWMWVSGSSVTSTASTADYGTLGQPAATNVPGGRSGAVAWIDGAGVLHLFAGNGYGAGSVSTAEGNLNDLWTFDPASGEWTWVGGSDTVNQPGSYGTLGVAAPGNWPGARSNGAYFVQNGTVWVYGGEGTPGSSGTVKLDDVWSYSETSGQWTWAALSDSTNSTDDGQTPGSRYGSVFWLTPTGQAYLFDGDGVDQNGNTGILNDLWEDATL